MRAITFFVLTTLGSLIQTSAVIVLVWLTAEQAARVVGFIDSKSDYLTWIFSACVIAWILTVSVYRPLRTRHERRASGTTDGEGEAP
jgi:membrane protein DedA with SNARE-associated domain